MTKSDISPTFLLPLKDAMFCIDTDTLYYTPDPGKPCPACGSYTLTSHIRLIYWLDRKPASTPSKES